MFRGFKGIAPTALGILSIIKPGKIFAAYSVNNNPAINELNAYGINTPTTVAGYVSFILNLIMIVGTFGVFIMVAVGAMTYLVSAGDEEQTKRGYNMMINAAIGFAILVASWSFVTWLIKITTGASSVNLGL